jgi:hypothetical protein
VIAPLAGADGTAGGRGDMMTGDPESDASPMSAALGAVALPPPNPPDPELPASSTR